MNYRLLFLISLIGLATNLSADEQPVQFPVKPEQLVRPSNRFELRGCIKVENASADRVPEYRIYYQGKEQRSNNEGFFSLPLDTNNIQKYSLVICKKIDQQFEKSNTVAFYGVIPDKNYRYFTFRPSNNHGQWLAQEKKLTKKNFVIPQHAIVALVDPKCVDRLELWNLNLPEQVIKLPAIVLKSKLDDKVLNRSSAKSILYSLDSRPFHQTSRFERKVPGNNPKVQLVLDR
ncbi:hypothetical protein JST56_06290 [Candidatus Dependentiae bacterium]|nr:hypothetical protein [Candidatus Dependentiae bacterium]